MSASVLYMSMSLDGYIAGPNDEPDNPGGDGFDAAARVDRRLRTGSSADRPGPAGAVVGRMERDRRGAGGSAYRGAGRSLGR